MGRDRFLLFKNNQCNRCLHFSKLFWILFFYRNTTSASNYGISDFQVQYDNSGSWQTVLGGSISGNTLAWNKFTFSSVTTGKIRVNITAARAGYSRLVELQ